MAKQDKKIKSVDQATEPTTEPDHKQIVLNALSDVIKACDNAIPNNCCQKGAVLGHAIETLVRLKTGMEKHL